MHLTDALFDLCSHATRPIFAIDGPAGAGKTTLASHLRAALSQRYSCTVLHMDSLYHGWETPFDDKFTSALQHAVQSHVESRQYSLARYDWDAKRFGEPEPVAQSDLLILEGVGSIHTCIRGEITAAMWIELDPLLGYQRVLARDGEKIAQEMKRWLTQQEQHFLAQDSKNTADFILTN